MRGIANMYEKRGIANSILWAGGMVRIGSSFKIIAIY
jgi:hypothetical protein